MSRTACPLLRPLNEAARSRSSADVAVFRFGQEFQLDPGGLRPPDWLGSPQRDRQGAPQCGLLPELDNCDLFVQLAGDPVDVGSGGLE